jgi:hypothetical protein
MFDISSTEGRDTAIEAVKAFFTIYGNDLAEAALFLGGPTAEARVINCAVSVQTATTVDRSRRRDLLSFHRLLSLDAIGDAEAVDLWLYPDLDPGSPVVEAICFLTDRLSELLQEIGEPVPDPLAERPDRMPMNSWT